MLRAAVLGEERPGTGGRESGESETRVESPGAEGESNWVHWKIRKSWLVRCAASLLRWIRPDS